MAGVRVWRAKRVLRKLIAEWEDFGAVLSQVSLEEAPAPTVDKGLLDLEARIANYLPAMYDLCSGTYLDDEIREEVRSIGELVKRFTGKSMSGRLVQDEVKSMVAEWNSHFVFLNKLMGSRSGPGVAEEEGLMEVAGVRARRHGGLRGLGRNNALRFVAKALVVIILLVVVVNMLGGPAAELFTSGLHKVTGKEETVGPQPSYKSPGISHQLISLQQKVRVFTTQHQSLITMGALVIAAFAILYLVLFRGG